MAAIPQHEWLMRSLFAYDLVGLQSEADVAHFTRYVRNEGSAEAVDEKRVRAFGATVVVQSFPIGIDVDEFKALTHAEEAMDMYHRMREEYNRRRLLLGIDRLDYSKGLNDRFTAFGDGLPQKHAYHLVYRHALDVDASGQVLAITAATELYSTSLLGRRCTSG